MPFSGSGALVSVMVLGAETEERLKPRASVRVLGRAAHRNQDDRYLWLYQGSLRGQLQVQDQSEPPIELKEQRC